MKKLASIGTTFAMASVLFTAAPVFADSPGQLSNGTSNYKVYNVTKGGEYGQTTTATCGETVKYSITLSNSDYGQLSDLTVKADLASGAISASAKTSTGTTTSVSGNAKATATKGTLTYVKGSTVRITEDNQLTTAVADGITGNGVNVGDLKGSTAIRVQFQAEVECPTTPTTPGTPTTPTTPDTLVNTGAGNVVALFAVVTAAAAVAYNWVMRRQNAR